MICIEFSFVIDYKHIEREREEKTLTILFWVVVVILLLVMMVSLFKSTDTKSAGDKYADLLVGVVAFACLVIFISTLGGVM